MEITHEVPNIIKEGGYMLEGGRKKKGRKRERD